MAPSRSWLDSVGARHFWPKLMGKDWLSRWGQHRMPNCWWEPHCLCHRSRDQQSHHPHNSCIRNQDGEECWGVPYWRVSPEDPCKSGSALTYTGWETFLFRKTFYETCYPFELIRLTSKHVLFLLMIHFEPELLLKCAIGMYFHLLGCVRDGVVGVKFSKWGIKSVRKRRFP